MGVRWIGHFFFPQKVCKNCSRSTGRGKLRQCDILFLWFAKRQYFWVVLWVVGLNSSRNWVVWGLGNAQTQMKVNHLDTTLRDFLWTTPFWVFFLRLFFFFRFSKSRWWTKLNFHRFGSEIMKKMRSSNLCRVEHPIFLEDGDRAASRRASSLAGAKGWCPSGRVPDRLWFGLSYFSHQNTEATRFYGMAANVVVMLERFSWN